MAALETSGPDPLPSVVNTDSPCPEVAKESPLENLMDKLRSKSSQYKPWGEMSKAMRVAITEKRHIMDSTDRTQLQKVLDILQKSIKVSSLQSMIERLDSISRQQGLKFSSGPPNTECYISSDIFYVEIELETSGEVKDVKIFHHGDPVTCPELVKVLRSGNFTEFTKHLEGLAAIYQLNADKKQKTKAYLALQALEEDLSMLAQLQREPKIA